jgi:hypothetical protein
MGYYVGGSYSSPATFNPGVIPNTARPGTSQSYNDYMQLNQNSYCQILQGYNSLQSQQMAAQGQITQGYQNLQNQVLGGIQGVQASQLQAIQDVYAQQEGASQQQAINAGLGNSTVLASLQRGNTLCYAKARTAVCNAYAQTLAGYQSNLGLAGLNYQNQANQQAVALGAQQLGYMQDVTKLPYSYSQSMAGGGGGGGGGGGASYGKPGILEECCRMAAMNKFNACLINKYNMACMAGQYGLAETNARGQYGLAQSCLQGQYGLQQAQIQAQSRRGNSGCTPLSCYLRAPAGGDSGGGNWECGAAPAPTCGGYYGGCF